MRQSNTMNRVMHRFAGIAAAFAIAILFGAQPSDAQTATISGKLIDRQCSVIDALQQQPLAEYRCTLWVEVTYACTTGACKITHTVYCPNTTADNRPMNSAFWTCVDDGGMQIRGGTVTITGYLRTPTQQLDHRGEILGYSFQY